MKNIISLVVENQENGHRIDLFISNKYLKISRTRVKNLIKKKNLKINNTIVTDPSKKVSAGDIILLEIPEPKKVSLKPYNYKLDIIYEDKDLIVINKSAGISMHPGPGNYDNTLVNALIAHCGESLSGIGGEKKPGIVHRLDKDTSGVMVIAKNDSTHESLSEQFANHGRDGKLIRSYKALVWGIPNIQSGKIETFIGRSDKNRKKMAVYKEEKKGRRFAITHWKRIKFNKELDISKIQCNLETGRTHQIRVHLTHIGLPVIGDQVYGTGFKSKLNKYDDGIRNILLNASKRQSLHAYKLGFEHPTSKKNMLFETNLPHAMQEVSDIL